jgi:hypothetical protein
VANARPVIVPTPGVILRRTGSACPPAPTSTSAVCVPKPSRVAVTRNVPGAGRPSRLHEPMPSPSDGVRVASVTVPSDTVMSAAPRGPSGSTTVPDTPPSPGRSRTSTTIGSPSSSTFTTLLRVP